MSKIHHALKKAELHRIQLYRARSRKGGALVGPHECANAAESESASRGPDLKGLQRREGVQPIDRRQGIPRSGDLKEGLLEEGRQVLSREIRVYAREQAGQIRARLDEICRELLAGVSGRPRPLQEAPSPLEVLEEPVSAARASLNQTQAPEPPSEELAQQLVHARETLIRELEERVREGLLSLIAHMERSPAQAAPAAGLDRKNARFRSESLQRQLDEQLRAFENRVHDVLLDARGQLKGSVQYALENSWAPFEERAQQAEERIAAAAKRSMERLNEILAVAQNRAQRIGLEAGQVAPMLWRAFCQDLQAAGSTAPAPSRSAGSNRKPSNRKHQ